MRFYEMDLSKLKFQKLSQNSYNLFKFFRILIKYFEFYIAKTSELNYFLKFTY
jgi:hypothetical protein